MKRIEDAASEVTNSGRNRLAMVYSFSTPISSSPPGFCTGSDSSSVMKKSAEAELEPKDDEDGRRP